MASGSSRKAPSLPAELELQLQNRHLPGNLAQGTGKEGQEQSEQASELAQSETGGLQEEEKARDSNPASFKSVLRKISVCGYQ